MHDIILRIPIVTTLFAIYFTIILYNIYAFIFLVGGAILSAYRYRKVHDSYHRFIGNVYIAIGALLPGIGGTFTRMGYTEVLYVTELMGLVLIYIGYRYNVRPAPVHSISTDRLENAS